MCNFGFSKKSIYDNYMSGYELEEIEEYEMNFKMLGESEFEEIIIIK